MTKCDGDGSDCHNDDDDDDDVEGDDDDDGNGDYCFQMRQHLLVVTPVSQSVSE